MPSPIIFLLLFFVIDLLVKRNEEKNKTEQTGTNTTFNENVPKRKSTFADLVKKFEDQFDEATQESKIPVKPVLKTQPRREGVANESRDEWISSQEAKINKHSDYEKNRILKRETLMKKSRLGDSQVPLASKMSKRNMNDYDLDKKRKVSIETLSVSGNETKTDSDRTLNIKEDILKGFIYSEILAKPKSLEK